MYPGALFAASLAVAAGRLESGVEFVDSSFSAALAEAKTRTF
jgi:hypothetical protein